MARATKKPPRAKTTKKQDTTLTPDDRTGVEVDENGEPVYIEKVTDEERAAGNGRLAKMNIELRELEQEAKDSASDYRGQIKDLKKSIADLSDEVDKGVRKEGAQAGLPGVDG